MTVVLSSPDSPIKCPVCKNDCIKDAEKIISSLNSIFLKCPHCRETVLNRQKPPESIIGEPCPVCGRRSLDDIIVHCYLIMAEEGGIPPGLPLAKTGTPLLNPGFAIKTSPYLPENSLVLLTPYAGSGSAERIVREVSEVKGVVKDNGVVPGISFADDGIESKPVSVTNTLLAGCDVRCDVFHAGNVPFVTYKNQSAMHIEFPRGFDPKIRSVETNVMRYIPETFVDACAGSGTLGISAALFGVNSVTFNDIWYPASYWTAVNLYSNRKALEILKSEFFFGYKELKEASGEEKLLKTAHFEGKFCSFDVYLGDYRELSPVIGGVGTLAAIDVFEKKNKVLSDARILDWKIKAGGDAFIP